ncbi:adenylate/guanylate cyclase domain-containing protein [uncultured Ruegeria sp.]|uniref:adenylate/guanylate cyclase domain-containing protein n=1 Tax=uncultured Ruegeria sp. TaxID=259304 RepID=UPI002627B488|nr:adenylate/guanylate cyclase domain-containing protein [uncultured Ruegeria sp.]
MTRRLLTILAADVADYTRHVEADEDTALSHLAALRGLMDPIITTHHGLIANTAGDSVLAWFESPVEALRAAIELQQAHKIYNDSVHSTTRLLFRVGINIGDVTVQSSGDILGHGVNIAARLEALAEPGGICVSQNVMDQVGGKIELAFSKVGEHRVKNVTKPISVYSVGDSNPLGLRLRRRMSQIMRNPIVPVGISVCVAVMAIGVFYYALNQRPGRGEGFDVARLLENASSSEEILSAFDLVTTGTFEDHTYHVVQTWGGYWAEFEELAHALGGYPVAIGSQAENDFVFNLTLRDEGHWVVYDVPNDGKAYEGPMIGLVQEEGAPEPAGGWFWLNGEPLTFTNWAPGAPGNWRGNQDLANFANPRKSAPSPEWGDTPGIHMSVVIEVPN